MKNDIKNHYDKLIEINNDPVNDCEELKKHMNKWDGNIFIEELCLTETKIVLEIGIGTGRLALKTAPQCKYLFGIDISEKTIERAKQNLFKYDNINLIYDDFLEHNFIQSFDMIYSSLTFMHIKDKQYAIKKVSQLLNNKGRFVLSIDKNKSDFINIGCNKIKIFPDNLDNTIEYIKQSNLKIEKIHETEFAYVVVSVKQ